MTRTFIAVLILGFPILARSGDFPPYQGTVEERVWSIQGGRSELQTSLSASVARDSKGRIHTDKGEVIVIFDPVQRKKTTLHKESRTAEVVEVSPEFIGRYLSGDQTAPHVDPYDSEIQDLGKRVILGLEATGKLVSWRQQCEEGQGLCMEVQTEEWIAMDLGLHLSSHSKVYLPETGGTVEREYVYVDLDLSAPDPSLFLIPSDYEVRPVGGGKAQEE